MRSRQTPRSAAAASSTRPVDVVAGLLNRFVTVCASTRSDTASQPRSASRESVASSGKIPYSIRSGNFVARSPPGISTCSRCPVRTYPSAGDPVRISPPQIVASVPYPTPSIAMPTTSSVVTDAICAQWCCTGQSTAPDSSASAWARRVLRN